MTSDDILIATWVLRNGTPAKALPILARKGCEGVLIQMFKMGVSPTTRLANDDDDDDDEFDDDDDDDEFTQLRLAVQHNLLVRQRLTSRMFACSSVSFLVCSILQSCWFP